MIDEVYIKRPPVLRINGQIAAAGSSQGSRIYCLKENKLASFRVRFNQDRECLVAGDLKAREEQDKKVLINYLKSEGFK